MNSENQTNGNIQIYNRVGHKTFLLFVLKRILPSFFIALIGVVILLGYAYIPSDYAYIANIVLIALSGLFILVLALSFLLGWMEYVHYKIFIDEDNIKISRGLIDEEKIGIPFRRIKEANLERSLMDQMFGVSNVILMVLGEEEGANSMSGEAKIILPSLETKIASQIQETVLNKSEVEEVNMNPGAPVNS